MTTTDCPPFCTQMPVPPELVADARTLAIQENPKNVHSVTLKAGGPMNTGLSPSLALPIDTKWANGRTLRVKILNGSEKIKGKIRQYANVWTDYANITFDFVDSDDAEIRVNVDSSRRSWSYVGTNNLTIKSPRYTMNFGWLTDATAENEFSRVIIHEFGHALGCIHEHQSPAAGIPWDREAVYAYYSRADGWTRAETDKNLFKLYATDTTQFSAFDRNSIMLYAIPAELTTNGYSVGWNRELSETDKAFIGQVYPRPGGPRTHLVSGTFNTLEVRPWDQPTDTASKSVQFDSTFSSPPAVAVGLCMLDVGYSDDIRIKAYANEITNGGLKVNIDTWEPTTKIYSAACTWYAPPNSSDIQTGQFSTLDDHAWNKPQQSTSRQITFPRPYAAPPKVILWMNQLNMVKDKNWRFKATTSNVTATGFTVNLDTWADSVLYSAAVSWIAHPEDKVGVASGTYHTNDVNSGNTAELTNGGRVEFPAGKFQRPPTVIMALNAVDLGAGRNLRANLSVDAVTETGMNWHIDAWGDSQLYSAGASYIAFAP